MEKILFKEIITGWLGWWTPSATKGNQANGFAGVRTALDIYVPCLMKKTKNNKKKTHSISHCCTKTVILNIFKRSVFLKPACFSTLTKKSCASFTNSLIICVCIITEGTTTNCSQTPEHLSGAGLKAPRITGHLCSGTAPPFVSVWKFPRLLNLEHRRPGRRDPAVPCSSLPTTLPTSSVPFGQSYISQKKKKKCQQTKKKASCFGDWFPGRSTSQIQPTVRTEVM